MSREDFAKDSQSPASSPVSFGKREGMIFLSLVAVYAGTRAWRLFAFSIDHEDEYFSVFAAQKDVGGLLAAVAGDLVHPPLFYLLLKPWIAVGGIGNLWLALFPMLLSLAVLWPFLGLVRSLGVRPAERDLALALMAGSWYLMFFVDFLRMYSLLQFLSVCSLWLLVRYLQTDTDRMRWLLALTGINLLLVYTHYYGWLIVGAELAWILVAERSRLMAFSLSVAALVACFVPWVYAVVQNLGGVEQDMQSHLGWLSRPGLNTHLLSFYNFVSGFQPFPRSGYLWILLFLGPIALWGLSVLVGRSSSRPEARRFWFLACFAFLPAVTAFLASQVLPASVWHPRHLVITVVPFLLLVSVSVLRLRPRFLSAALVILTVVWTGTATVQHARGYLLVDWEGLARSVIQGEQEPGPAIPFNATNAFDGLFLKFYLERDGRDRFKVQFVCRACEEKRKWVVVAGGRGLAAKEVEEWSSLGEESMWFMFSPVDFPDGQDPVTVLSRQGYRPDQRYRSEDPKRVVEVVRLSRH